MGRLDMPLSTHSSAPLETKFENRLSDFPPSRLYLKLGKLDRQSLVFCGITGSTVDCVLGEPRGVMDDWDASRPLVGAKSEASVSAAKPETN